MNKSLVAFKHGFVDNNMNNSVFITGCTGFLGTEILEKLVKTTSKRIFVLVRADDLSCRCRDWSAENER